MCHELHLGMCSYSYRKTAPTGLPLSQTGSCAAFSYTRNLCLQTTVIVSATFPVKYDCVLCIYPVVAELHVNNYHL